LQTEDDLECIGGIAEAVASCLEECKEATENGFPIGVTMEQVPKVVETLLTVAASSASRRMQQLHENSQDEDFDEEAAQQLAESEEHEEHILQSAIDAIGWMIKVHKEAILPLFQQQIFPAITPFLDQNVLSAIRGPVLCTIDDIIEHCGPSAHALLPVLLPHILNV